MHEPTKSTFGDRACLNFLFLNKGYIKGSYTCILFEPTNNQLLNKILMNSHCSDIIQALPHSPLHAMLCCNYYWNISLYILIFLSSISIWTLSRRYPSSPINIWTLSRTNLSSSINIWTLSRRYLPPSQSCFSSSTKRSSPCSKFISWDLVMEKCYSWVNKWISHKRNMIAWNTRMKKICIVLNLFSL